MATPVLMPKQGQSVESCIITQWNKKKGDEVKTGDILFSYETDKASFEEEAKTDGILLEVFFEDGDEVPVLVNVAVIGQPGEPVDGFAPGVAQPAPEDKKEAPGHAEKKVEEAEEITASKPLPSQAAPADGKLKVSPRAKNMAQKMKVPMNMVSGTGPYGRVIARDIENAAAQGLKMTSAAFEQAKAENLSPSGQGSALGGRVSAAELRANPVYASGADYEMKKLSNIRKIIARGMFNSLQNAAQLTHHLSADARNILTLRAEIKRKQKEGQQVANLTLNDMVCFAVVKALKQHPAANSHFLGEQICEFKKVHLGLAVDTDRGLMVPVVKNADDLSLEGLANQMKSMADRCKKGSIDPELLAPDAASFTVSNLGGFGIEMFTPVLNLPQVGILGVNTIINRPADLGNGVFGFIPFLGLSLTYDHRAIDGAPASRFLATIKSEIENFSYTL
jgi:pyruvate dehydrogenase E2 component (dihydrolipoamide acetyltransferase)